MKGGQDIEKVRNRIVSVSLQNVLNFQTPWGEWGPGFSENVDLKKDKEYNRKDTEYTHKPNMSRTLRGIELLNSLNRNKFRDRISLALKWIPTNFDGSSNWFKLYETDGHANPLTHCPEVYYVKDIRHSAQAIIALMENDPDFKLFNYSKIIKDILERAVNDKYFSCRGPAIDELSSLWCIELLSVLPRETLEDIDELKELMPSWDVAWNNAIEWVSQQKDFVINKSGMNIYHQSAFLYRLSKILIEKRNTYFLAIISLITKSKNGRMITEDFSVHIAATYGLIMAKEAGAEISNKVLQDAQNLILEKFNELYVELSSPDFLNIVNIFCKNQSCKAKVVEGINNNHFFDYINEDLTDSRFSELDFFSPTDLFEWVVDMLNTSFSRIGKLETGRKKSQRYYDEVYLNEENNLSKLIDVSSKLTDNFSHIEIDNKTRRKLEKFGVNIGPPSRRTRKLIEDMAYGKYAYKAREFSDWLFLEISKDNIKEFVKTFFT